MVEYNCNLLNLGVPPLDGQVANGTSTDRVDLQLGVRRVARRRTPIGTKESSAATAPSSWPWLVPVILLRDLVGLYGWDKNGEKWIMKFFTQNII